MESVKEKEKEKEVDGLDKVDSNQKQSPSTKGDDELSVPTYVVASLKNGKPVVEFEAGAIFDRQKFLDSVSSVFSKYSFHTGKERSDYIQMLCGALGFSTEDINPLLNADTPELKDGLSALTEGLEQTLEKKSFINASSPMKIEEGSPLTTTDEGKATGKTSEFSLFLDDKAFSRESDEIIDRKKKKKKDRASHTTQNDKVNSNDSEGDQDYDPSEELDGFDDL